VRGYGVFSVRAAIFYFPSRSEGKANQREVVVVVIVEG